MQTSDYTSTHWDPYGIYLDILKTNSQSSTCCLLAEDVIIPLGNSILSSDHKPLAEPMVSMMYDAISCH